jgi:hypothetical protein
LTQKKANRPSHPRKLREIGFEVCPVLPWTKGPNLQGIAIAQQVAERQFIKIVKFADGKNLSSFFVKRWPTLPSEARFFNDLGPMLGSQFSAIFDNFWQKIGVFLKNQCYGHLFA